MGIFLGIIEIKNEFYNFKPLYETMKRFQRIIISLVVITFIFGIPIVQAAAAGVIIDGNPITFTQESGIPFVDKSNRTQVPLRITMEAAGCHITWDSFNKTAIVEKDNTIVKVPIGQSFIIINGVQKANDTAAQIKDGRTYLPIRAVLEAFGATVAWNQNTGNVEVKLKNASRIETINYANGVVYIGETLNGIPNNSGTMYFSNNDTYVGHWSDGNCNGYGVYTWSNGDSYAGEWGKGERTGYGTYTWSDGTTWTGDWENGEPVVDIKAPATVTAKAESSSEIKIGWSHVSDADYYYLYYSGSPSGPWLSFSDFSGKKTPQYWLGAFSSSLYGMAPSTTRYFKVTSVNNGVESDYSAIASTTTLTDTTSTNTQNSGSNISIIGPLSLYSDDGYYVYLGELTSNEKDLDSIFNKYGSYGSKYSSTSIWNEYGTYGSKYGLYSAFNQYSISPPIIVDGKGDVIGKLTVNNYVIGAISPYKIKQVLIDAGL